MQGVAGARVAEEAIEVLVRDGVFFGNTIPPSLYEGFSFKDYLLAKDPYGDFLTPIEYARFKSAQDVGYAGIGLQLERDSQGRIWCYPDPGGPAQRNGVSNGDELIALDGHPALGLALPTLVALAWGAPGSALDLEVVKKEGMSKHLLIVRRQLRGSSVVEDAYGGRTVLRVVSFTPNTRQELEFLLASRRRTDYLIFDLRGNRGGDLYAAIDCAMLFLGAGETAVSIREKRSMHAYIASAPSRYPLPSIYIWQDSGTASAAEVFIAALTDNGRATSIGSQSFGKGTKQDLSVLRSGSVLIFTSGFLLTPRGKEIDGVGLAPDQVVAGEDAMRFLLAANRLALRSR